MSRLRTHLTYSNVVSTLCLFLLLGGGAYAAATRVPKNSVGTQAAEEERRQGLESRGPSLTAADIRGAVESATEAAHAANADQAKNADRLGGLDSSAFQPAAKVRVYAPISKNPERTTPPM